MTNPSDLIRRDTIAEVLAAYGYGGSLLGDAIVAHPAVTDPQIATLQATNARLVEALRALEKTATETIRLGAVTGGHWSRITVANLKARAILAELETKA